jgi:Ribosomal protein S13
VDAGVVPTTQIKSLSEGEVEKIRHEIGKYIVEGDPCAARWVWPSSV